MKPAMTDIDDATRSLKGKADLPLVIAVRETRARSSVAMIQYIDPLLFMASSSDIGPVLHKAMRRAP